VRLTWPLIGRSQEMQVIGAAMSEPDSSGVVFCGAAGRRRHHGDRSTLIGTQKFPICRQRYSEEQQIVRRMKRCPTLS
jgi:hypothetical protein